MGKRVQERCPVAVNLRNASSLAVSLESEWCRGIALPNINGAAHHEVIRPSEWRL